MKTTAEPCLYSPAFLGDEVVFSGVVREISIEMGQRICVVTRRPDLWANNRFVSIVRPWNGCLENQPDYCPPYYRSNETPVHFLEQYVKDVRAALQLQGNFRISKFAGEVLPTEEEVTCPPFGISGRYWIVVAGWKGGNPTKAWPIQLYQEVVDSMRGRMQFVQVGAKEAWHPPLRGVRNLVGKTSIRQLISLVYHAEGVVCPITSIMHLAAAIPASAESGFQRRPCVVIAGGREAPHYISYPMHKVVNVVGQLECCAEGGCGKSRFGPGQCPYPTPMKGDLVPRCMTLIKPSDVVSAIEFYYKGIVSLPRRLGKAEAIFNRLQGFRVDSSKVNGAEIGFGEGELSEQLLRGESRLSLTMISDMQMRFNKAPAANVDVAIRRTSFAENRRTVVSTRAGSFYAHQLAPLDFVFISDSSLRNMNFENVRLWAKRLRSGGFICGQGYQTDAKGTHIRTVVDRFAMSLGKKVRLDKDKTWFVDV